MGPRARVALVLALLLGSGVALKAQRAADEDADLVVIDESAGAQSASEDGVEPSSVVDEVSQDDGNGLDDDDKASKDAGRADAADAQPPAAAATREEGRAAPAGPSTPSAAAEEEAFVTVRKQLAQSAAEGVALRHQLDEAVGAGRGMADKLVQRERSEREQLQHELQAQTQKAAAVQAAASRREAALSQRLNASEAHAASLSAELASVREDLRKATAELESARQAANSSASALSQERAAEQKSLLQRDSTITWLKTREQSKESELSTENVKLRGMLKKAVQELKDDRLKEVKARKALKRQSAEAQRREAALQKKVTDQAAQLKEEGRREGDLRQQLAALEQRARATGSEAARSVLVASKATAAADAPTQSAVHEDTTDSDSDVVEIPE